MKSSAEGALPAAPTPFQMPRDRQAWAPFLASSAGGWLAITHGAKPGVEASLLALAMASLFLASEWLSNLSGRGRLGLVEPARLLEPAGWALLGLLGLSLGAFFLRLQPLQRQAWGTVLIAAAALVALLFLLRREWIPLDRRLLALTHFLLTLPSLFFAFLHWGVGAPLAWKLWSLPALFFPSLALIGYAWLEGGHSKPSAPTLAVAPLLAGVVAAAAQGAWPLALVLGIWALRAMSLLSARLQDPGRLPPLPRIRAYALESEAWATAVTFLWLVFVWRSS